MIPRLALIAWVLVLALLMLGAYLRHTQAGSGCNEWPQCYGRIGFSIDSPTPNATPQALAGKTQPTWATRTHRAVAGLIAVLVVALAVLTVIRRERGSVLFFALLGLANLVFLIALGLWAGGSRSTLVTVGNLLGGIGLLGIMWWLYLLSRPPSVDKKTDGNAPTMGWLSIGLTLIVVTITLGALTGASYSTLSCNGFPLCADFQWSALNSTDIAAFVSPPPTDEYGVVAAGNEQIIVQILHRLTAGVLLAWGIAAAWRLLRSHTGIQGWYLTMLMLLVLQIALGISVALAPSVLVVALGHNIIAPLLLITALSVLQSCLVRRDLAAPDPLKKK